MVVDWYLFFISNVSKKKPHTHTKTKYPIECHSNNNDSNNNNKSRTINWEFLVLKDYSKYHIPHAHVGQLIVHIMVSADGIIPSVFHRHTNTWWKQSKAEQGRDNRILQILHLLQRLKCELANSTCKASWTGGMALCLLLSSWRHKHNTKCLDLQISGCLWWLNEF